MAVKIVQSSVKNKLFLVQLRHESDCRFATKPLLKLVVFSVLVLSFTPESNVVQVLLKEHKKYIEFFTSQNCPSNRVREYLQRKTNVFSTQLIFLQILFCSNDFIQ